MTTPSDSPHQELPASELPASELPASELPASELPASELPDPDRTDTAAPAALQSAAHEDTAHAAAKHQPSDSTGVSQAAPNNYVSTLTPTADVGRSVKPLTEARAARLRAWGTLWFSACLCMLLLLGPMMHHNTLYAMLNVLLLLLAMAGMGFRIAVGHRLRNQPRNPA